MSLFWLKIQKVEFFHDKSHFILMTIMLACLDAIHSDFYSKNNDRFLIKKFIYFSYFSYNIDCG